MATYSFTSSLLKDYKEMWTDISLRLKTIIPHAQFITWFKKSVIVEVDGDLVVIGVPLPMAMEWINKNFRDELLKTIQEFNPSIQQINLQVDTDLSQDDDPRHINQEIYNQTNPNKGRKKTRQGEVVLANGLETKILDRSFSLSNFVTGNDNRLAHAACMAVASSPGRTYNPLFIYGTTGLGKTHLLQATGNLYHIRSLWE